MDRTLVRVRIGFPDRANLHQALLESCHYELESDSDYDNQVSEMFIRYAEGNRIDFGTLEIDQSWMTDFQKSVVASCRSIPYGETLSYAELATLAGTPGASRAVGTVMASNRFPIVVPCHRVLAAGRKMGGFSAPRGTEFKREILELEGAIRQKGLSFEL